MVIPECVLVAVLEDGSWFIGLKDGGKRLGDAGLPGRGGGDSVGVTPRL